MKHIKSKNPIKFLYIVNFGMGDFKKGIQIYNATTNRIQRQIEDIYFSLCDDRTLSIFYKYFAQDLYKSRNSFIRSISSYSFKEKNNIDDMATITKMQTIIDRYSIYKGLIQSPTYIASR